MGAVNINRSTNALIDHISEGMLCRHWMTQQEFTDWAQCNWERFGDSKFAWRYKPIVRVKAVTEKQNG